MSDSEIPQGAAYDPTNTANYDEQEMLVDDDDDDYDPSNMQFQEAQSNEQAARADASHTAQSTASTKQRTVGGFIEDDDDEDESAIVSAPLQLGPGAAAPLSATPVQDQRSVTQTPVNATPDITIQKTATPVPAAQNINPEGAAIVTVPDISIENAAATSTNGVASPAAPHVAASGLAPSQSPLPSTQTQSNVSLPVAAPSVQSASSTSVPLPKARLPQDRVGILEDRISADPRGDTDAWLSLIEEYKQRSKIQETYETYERFLKIFPQAGDQWAAYIQLMMQNEDTKKAASAFNEVLLKVPHVKCWSLYIDYIRRMNPIGADPNSNSRNIINAAFDFTFKHIGQDPASLHLWQDYITFVKTMPGNIAGDGWQDKQKVDATRKAYRQALSVPLPNLQPMWLEYSNFEISASRVNGRKFQNEQMPAYMTAKQAYIALESRIKFLDRSTLPKFPPLPGYDGYAEYQQQLQIWRNWIEYEKTDPNLLKEDQPDGTNFKARVLFVYKVALMTLRFEPQMWFDAAQFCLDNNMSEDGEKLLDEGLNANPESCLLAFAKADRIETKTVSENDPAERGKSVRQPYNKVIDALYELLKQTKERQDREVAEIQERFAKEEQEQTQTKEAGNSGSDDDDEQPNDAERRAKDTIARREAETNEVKEKYNTQLNELKRLITTAWVALIRAMRRIQGKGKPGSSELPGSRGILSETRKRGNITSDLYIQCALTEWYCYKDPAALRLFDKGMTLYPTDENFALEYIRHLISQSDLTNARTVFEKAVSRLASDPKLVQKAKPLYYYFHTFESKYGELAQIQKLEQRMRDLFPEDPSLRVFAHRFEYENALQKSFDATKVQPIISPNTQMKPVAVQSIEQDYAGGYLNAPGVLDNGLGISSPKRPYGADGSMDGPPRKMQRGESPFKTGAARRLANTSRSTPLQTVAHLATGNWPVPAHVNYLLRTLPDAKYATNLTPQLDSDKLVNVMRGVNLQPNIWGSANLRNAGPGLMDSRYHQPPPTAGLPAPPPQMNVRPPPPMQYGPPQGMPPQMPPQYGQPPPASMPPQGYYQPPPSTGYPYSTPVNVRPNLTDHTSLEFAGLIKSLSRICPALRGGQDSTTSSSPSSPTSSEASNDKSTNNQRFTKDPRKRPFSPDKQDTEDGHVSKYAQRPKSPSSAEMKEYRISTPLLYFRDSSFEVTATLRTSNTFRLRHIPMMQAMSRGERTMPSMVHRPNLPSLDDDDKDPDEASSHALVMEYLQFATAAFELASEVMRCGYFIPGKLVWKSLIGLAATTTVHYDMNKIQRAHVGMQRMFDTVETAYGDEELWHESEARWRLRWQEQLQHGRDMRVRQVLCLVMQWRQRRRQEREKRRSERLAAELGLDWSLRAQLW